MSDSVAVFARIVAEMIATGADKVPLESLAMSLADRSSVLCRGADTGVVFLGQGDEPAAVGGSTMRARDLVVLGMRLGEGPTHEALATGVRSASVGLLGEAPGTWFRTAREAGYDRVHAFLLRGEHESIGVITVFASAEVVEPGLMQAFADVVVAHLVRQAELEAARTQAGQLERALRDRVLIEQTKGRIAQRSGVPPESAFGSLRRYARNHNQRLAMLCESITSGEIDLASIPVDFFPMSGPRRSQLREQALARSRETSTEALRHQERASRSVSRSVELRLELEHARALRDADALGQAIDRLFREHTRATPPVKQRPRVLVREGTGRLRSFVTDALRGDTRFDVDAGSNDTETLARSIVEQPDLVILAHDDPPEGQDGYRSADDEVPPFRGQLRRYCPDSRTLLVAGGPEDGGSTEDASGLGAEGCDAIVPYGDARALVELTAKLCGLHG